MSVRFNMERLRLFRERRSYSRMPAPASERRGRVPAGWLLLLALLVPSCTQEGRRPEADLPSLALKPGEALPADYGSVSSLVELAERTLAFVEGHRPLPKAKARLADLKAAVAGENRSERLLKDLRELRREIIFAHPALDFDRLIINKRPPAGFDHQSDQYLGRHSGVGDGLVVLDSWKKQAQETALLKGKLPPGSVLHPDLSFDGRRILFSYCDHAEPDAKLRRFFIWEINVDGSGLRQLTGTSADRLLGLENRETALVEDWDPCYLPDGGFAFVSTRNQGGVRCHNGRRYCPTYTLYRAASDGSTIRPLSYGEANEWDPSVLHDGRVIWTRWDYINRPEFLYQSLWTIHPDGAATSHFYGNYTENPCMIAEARAIPGSHKIVGTATAHHMSTAGSIVVIDPRRGEDGEEPLTRITPEVTFPETELNLSVRQGLAPSTSETAYYPETAYATPWPLSEDLFLVAYSPEYWAETNSYAIYLVDTLGGRELIYRDPEMSCYSPIPVQPRPIPPALATRLNPLSEKSNGQFYVQNVYESVHPIPAGSVQALRVIRVIPQPTQNAPGRSTNLYELPKKIVGTVPIAADGSVCFEAPAGTPLLFQLIDENGMCVMGMRTFVYLHPGEKQSCVGCHETSDSAPPGMSSVCGITLQKPVPPRGPSYEGGLSFLKTVQPVLDRYCIECHGLGEDVAGDVGLLGTMDPEAARHGRIRANEAYRSLIDRSGLVSIARRNAETVRSKPMDYYSHAGRLAKMLLHGDEHHECVDAESFERVVNWLDLNAQFYGDYSWNKDEWRAVSPDGEEALRRHVQETFGPEIAAQPLAALINVGFPSESRILKAPLASDSGGWGQLNPGWQSTNVPGYLRMSRLVHECIVPLETQDAAGTCNQERCVCRSCWVRKLRAEVRQ